MATKTNTKPKAKKETSPIVTDAPLSAADLQDRIAARAYEIFLARNGTPGDDLSDWLRAEHEVCSALSNSITDGIAQAISATPKRKRTSITQTSKTTAASSSTRKPKTAGVSGSQKEKRASK
jgi:hypothetical protein